MKVPKALWWCLDEEKFTLGIQYITRILRQMMEVYPSLKSTSILQITYYSTLRRNFHLNSTHCSIPSIIRILFQYKNFPSHGGINFSHFTLNNNEPKEFFKVRIEMSWMISFLLSLDLSNISTPQSVYLVANNQNSVCNCRESNFSMLVRSVMYRRVFIWFAILVERLNEFGYI